MTRGRDVVTTLVLVGAGLLVGELCVRVRTYRGMAASRAEDFTVISSAARLMAVGEDGSMVVEALAGELVSRLGLNDCEFEHSLPTGDRPYVARDGSLFTPTVNLKDRSCVRSTYPCGPAPTLSGHYRLYLSPGPPPSPDRLLAAVGIAEQAGAALAGSHSPPPPVPLPPRRLRLLR